MVGIESDQILLKEMLIVLGQTKSKVIGEATQIALIT